MKTAAMVLAGGNGSRFGSRKQWLYIDGESVTARTINLVRPYVDDIMTMIPWGCDPEDVPGDVDTLLFESGTTRYDSIAKWFQWVPREYNVLIVDAVRCNTPPEVVLSLVTAVCRHKVASPVIRAENTTCYIRGGRLDAVCDKNDMYEVQTPTAFQWEALQETLDAMEPEEGFSFLFGAMKAGITDIALVEGSRANVKITYPEDVHVLEGMKRAG